MYEFGTTSIQRPKKSWSQWLLAIVLLPCLAHFATAQDSRIAQVQSFLLQLGYTVGPVDGFMGTGTSQAIENYQRDRGLPVTGQIDPSLLEAVAQVPTQFPLEVAPVFPAPRLVREQQIVALEDQPQQSQQPEPATQIATEEPAFVPPPAAQPTTSPVEGLTDEPEVPPEAVAQAAPELQDQLESDTSNPAGMATPLNQPPGERNRQTTLLYGLLLLVGSMTVARISEAFWLGFWRRRRRAAMPGASLNSGSESRNAFESDLPESVGKIDPSSVFDHNPEADSAAPDQLIPTAHSHPPITPTSSNYNSAVPSRTVESSKPISGSRTATKPANSSVKSNSSWIPANEIVEIAGRRLRGMIYVGAPPRLPNGERSRPYIDPTLPVARVGDDLEGDGMPYWPGYSNIPAKSRATYLDWLSSGRSNTDYNPGYMFLYFYGLERRFVLDGADREEKQQILLETERLAQAFSWNRSARNYLGRFNELAQWSLRSNTELQPVFENNGAELPLAVRMSIGIKLVEQQPLDADWLLSWVWCDPDTRLRTPAHRCKPEFVALFGSLFRDLYPDGLAIQPPKTPLKVSYRAASNEFDVSVSPKVNGQPIPDISRLRRPVEIGGGIAEQAIKELEKYSRYLGRVTDGRGTLEAHSLLPERLLGHVHSDELEALRSWAEELVQAGGLVPAREVVTKLESSPPIKLGKKQLTGAADALARVGIGLAPDPRFAIRSPTPDEPVVLFHLPERTFKLEEVTASYRFALLELTIGAFVAQLDGVVSSEEKDALQQSISHAPGLTDSERSRLNANLSWLLAVPPDLPLLRQAIKQANEEQRQEIKKVVIGMANADSVVSADEVGGIEKIYKVMGFEGRDVYSDLHASGSDDPIVVRQAILPPKGEQIPPESTPPSNSSRLDRSRIEATKQSTERAAMLLGQVFGGDDDDVEEGDELSEAATAIPELDHRYRAFIAELIGRLSWTSQEFDELVGRHGLMVDGCLETINEWSVQRFDDLLIEAYDEIDLNSEIVTVLEGQI